jgi:hypothetical protein
MKDYFEVNGIKVWRFDESEIVGNMNSVTCHGCIMMFAIWLFEHQWYVEDYIVEEALGTIMNDVYGNTSGIRYGNRVDFMENYKFANGLYGNLEFSNLYYHKNGICYARVYDKDTDTFVGFVEINC